VFCTGIGGGLVRVTLALRDASVGYATWIIIGPGNDKWHAAVLVGAEQVVTNEAPVAKLVAVIVTSGHTGPVRGQVPPQLSTPDPLSPQAGVDPTQLPSGVHTGGGGGGGGGGGSHGGPCIVQGPQLFVPGPDVSQAGVAPTQSPSGTHVVVGVAPEKPFQL
jgi:hypothetical protein